MITHKIEKRKPWNASNYQYKQYPYPSTIGQPWQRPAQQQHPNLPVVVGVPANDTATHETDPDRIAMGYYSDKHNYNQYINQVRGQYPKGKVVTLRMFPYVPGRVPALFTCEEIQEIRHLVEFCKIMKTPRCLFIKSCDKDGISQFISPRSVRSLTPEEERLVNVLDPKAEEIGVSPSASLDAATEPDADTPYGYC